MNKTTSILAVTTLALALTGCSGPNDFQPTPDMAGAEIFANTCAVCHGENGQGKFGFLLKLAGEDESIEEIATKIQLGGKIMPNFPNFSEQDRMNVAAYVKSL